MEKQTTASLTIPPLAWAAGIAILLFSLTGIAILMGWIPASIEGTGTALEARSTPLRLPAPAETREPPAAPVRQAEAAPRRPAAPLRSAVPFAPVPPGARCEECGVIESIREIGATNDGANAYADGSYGTSKPARQAKAYAVTVRLEDGTSRVFSGTAPSDWHAGDRVRIVNGAIESDA